MSFYTIFGGGGGNLWLEEFAAEVGLDENSGEPIGVCICKVAVSFLVLFIVSTGNSEKLTIQNGCKDGSNFIFSLYFSSNFDFFGCIESLFSHCPYYTSFRFRSMESMFSMYWLVVWLDLVAFPQIGDGTV